MDVYVYTVEETATRATYEETVTSVRRQEETTTSLTSQDATTTPRALRKSLLSSLMTTQLPSTLDQNADTPHQSLVVIAGTGFSLQCSSPVKTIFLWSYCALGSDELETVYNGAKVDLSSPLASSVTVRDCGARSCTFNVDALSLDYAGFFACIRRAVQRSWSVTVLGKFFTCGCTSQFAWVC